MNLMHRIKTAVITIAITGIACLFSCTTDYVTGERTFSLVSESQEIAMGKEADPQIVGEYGLYNDSELATMIDRLGQRLASVSQRPNLQYTFRVLDSPVINAFALPGGYVYVTRGILAHFNSEDQLAGVLGHEIGHVVARHSAEQMSRVQLASLGLGVGSLISEDFQKFAGIAEVGVGLLFLKFSRGQESESDMLGVEYSTKLGYDANEMAGFFRTLKMMSAGSGQSLPSFLSTHPDPGDRESNVHALADEWQAKIAYSPLNKQRYDYLKKIDGIVYGDDPRHGYSGNGMFYHPEMTFQFPVPSGWTVVNSASTVQLVSDDKKAVVQLTLGSGSSQAAEVDAFVSKTGATVVARNQTSVNGFSALMVESKIGGEQPLQILSSFISKDGKIFIFHGFTSPDLFNTFSLSFRSVMMGFERATDPAVLNKKPARLAVKQAPRSGSLASVLTALGMGTDMHAEMALLNGMNLDDQIRQGEWIKIVME